MVNCDYKSTYYIDDIIEIFFYEKVITIHNDIEQNSDTVR